MSIGDAVRLAMVAPCLFEGRVFATASRLGHQCHSETVLIRASRTAALFAHAGIPMANAETTWLGDRIRMAAR